MKLASWTLAGVLALVPLAHAQVFTSEPQARHSALGLFPQLEESVKQLRRSLMLQTMAQNTVWEPTIRARLVDLERKVRDVRKTLHSPVVSDAELHGELDSLVSAYFQVVQSVGWLQRSSTVAERLPPVQQAMDQLVAIYGGYGRFTLPSGVDLEELPVIAEVKISRDPAGSGVERIVTQEVDPEEIDFQVMTDRTLTTVTSSRRAG
jgi:hypothetical protein